MKHLHLGCMTGTLAAAVTGPIFAWRAPSWRYIAAFRASLYPITNPTAVATAALELAIRGVFAANDFTGGTDVSDRTGAGLANYALGPRIANGQRIRGALPTEGQTQQQLPHGRLPLSSHVAGDIRVASTAALGAGAAASAQPWSARGQTYPAAATAQAVPPLVMEWKNPNQGLEHEDPAEGCLVLAPDTGLVLRLPIALAAGFTAVVTIEADFFE